MKPNIVEFLGINFKHISLLKKLFKMQYDATLREEGMRRNVCFVCSHEIMKLFNRVMVILQLQYDASARQNAQNSHG